LDATPPLKFFQYLPTEFLAPGTELTVDLVGRELKATVVEQPWYDPDNEKLLS